MSTVAKMLLLSGIMLAACTSAEARRGEQDGAGGPGAGGEVSVEFRLEDVDGASARNLRPGDIVRFVFEVHNGSAASRRLAYTFPPHRVDVLNAETGEPAWQAWEGRMFQQVVRQQRLSPGERTVFTVEWQTAASLPPGRYRASPSFHGFLQPGDQPLQPKMAAITFEIRR